MSKFNSSKGLSLLLLFMVAMATILHAQRKGYVTASIGTGIYFGDLSDQWRTTDILPAGSIQLGWYVNRAVSFRGVITQGTLGASDSRSLNEARNSRNLSFRSPLTELQLGVVYELFPDKTFHIRWKRNIHVSPLIFAGLAGFHFNPQALYQGEWVALQPLGTEGQYLAGHPDGPYRLTQLSFPAGVGLSVRFPGQIALWAELGYRKTLTDYLDDVSRSYPDPSLLGAPTAALSNRSGDQFLTGAKRGNPGAKDNYAFLSVGIGYFLGQ